MGEREKEIASENALTVPYKAFETTCARADRRDHRKNITIIIALVLLFLSNLAWMIAFTGYDYISKDVTVESLASGNANYVDGVGDIINGTDSRQDENKNP